LEITLEDAEAVCKLLTRPDPSKLDQASRNKLLTYLTTEQGHMALLSIEATKE